MLSNMPQPSRYVLRSYAAKRKNVNHTESNNVGNKRSRRDMLHEQGYQVFKGAIAIDQKQLDSINKAVAHGMSAIFNHNDLNKCNDRKRRQRSLPLKTLHMKAFDAQLKNFVKETVNTALTPANPVILNSLPGCQAQAAHCDYEPNAALKAVSDEQMPLALVVSLMQGTKLKIWPNSSRLVALTPEQLKKVDPIHCQELQLSPGDIIVFRGDFVHAGSDYAQSNTRIHYYLDSEMVPRLQNRTWLISKHGSEALRSIIQHAVMSIKPPVLKQRFI
jgi:hypothetical protein